MRSAQLFEVSFCWLFGLICLPKTENRPNGQNPNSRFCHCTFVEQFDGSSPNAAVWRIGSSVYSKKAIISHLYCPRKSCEAGNLGEKALTLPMVNPTIPLQPLGNSIFRIAGDYARSYICRAIISRLYYKMKVYIVRIGCNIVA